MKNLDLHKRTFVLLYVLCFSAVIIVKSQSNFEYEEGVDYNNPNQVYDINPVDSPFQDMGNNDFEQPPDFGSDPFPDPNQDPFSRQNQVLIHNLTFEQ